MIKWTLFNMLISFATSIIALLSISKHMDLNLTQYEKRKAYLAKSIAIYIAIVSCLVCLFSERAADTHMMLADRWTIILIFLFIGELMTDYFVSKKCHPKDWDKKSNE